MNAIPERKMEEDLDFNPNDAKRYRIIVGSLLYIAIKPHPDLCVVASSLSPWVESPYQASLMAAIRALKYINGLVDCSMKVQPGYVNKICAYVDSSWELQQDKILRSPTGIVVQYGSALVYAVGKWQKTISLSSTEADFRAFAEGWTFVVWLRGELEELGTDQLPVLISQHNIGAIAWVEGGPTKHWADKSS